MTKLGKSISRRTVIRSGAVAAAALAAPFVWTGRSQAADATLTITSWGGDYHKSVKEVFAEPFTKETGIPVTLVDNGDMAKVKAQVQSNAVQWDVIDAPAAFATSGANEGLWEELDSSIVNMKGVDDPDRHQDLHADVSLQRRPAVEYESVIPKASIRSTSPASTTCRSFPAGA